MIKNKWVIVVCFVGYCFSVAAQNMGWMIKPKYEAISGFNDGIAAVLKDGKWGYISDQGTEILAPEYDVAYPFSEGIGVLASKDRMLIAIVDRKGKLTPIRERLQIDNRFAAFSDGLLLVTKGKKWGYLNKNGQQAIDCKYDIAQPFSAGLAAAVLNSRQCYCWYYMDLTGKAVFHLSDLKKDIYWALGFYEGKALVLHSKGALFIDKNGQELKLSPPQITPPEAAAAYSMPTLACNEGILAFDEKCRAVSFITRNGKETKFIPTPSNTAPKPEYTININGATLAANDIRWLNSTTAIVKDKNSKYGLLTVYNNPVLTFSLSSDTLTSEFGNPVTADLKIRNISPRELDKIDIRVNEKRFEAASLVAGSTVSYPLWFDKTTDSEIETKNFSVVVYEEGLKIGESKETVYIRDLPSLRISVPTNRITLQSGQSAYTVKVQVKNLSNMQVNNVTVSIDKQTQLLTYLGGGETGIVQFTFPKLKESVTKTFYISAKAPNAPPVTVNVKVTIDESLPPPPTF